MMTSCVFVASYCCILGCFCLPFVVSCLCASDDDERNDETQQCKKGFFFFLACSELLIRDIQIFLNEKFHPNYITWCGFFFWKEKVFSFPGGLNFSSRFWCGGVRSKETYVRTKNERQSRVSLEINLIFLATKNSR